MLYGLQEVTSVITRTLSNQSNAGKTIRGYFRGNTIDAITTDDLIPLMADAIIKSKLKRVISILYYIEYFVFTNINASSLG
jgi:hypothetical protein